MPCKAATTAAITLSGEQTVDGISCITGDRVLVKNQSDSKTNGIYVCDTGSWARDLDFDGAGDAVTGTIVGVVNGSTNANTYWRLTTTGTVNFGSSAITFDTALAASSVPASVKRKSVGIIIDNVGFVITAGVKADIVIPWTGVIKQWTVLGDQVGNIVVDIWKSSYASAPPVVGGSITGTQQPSLASAIKNQSASLGTWTTAVTAEDVLRFNVNSAIAITRASVLLEMDIS